MARFSFDVQPNTVQIIRNTMDNGTDVFVIVEKFDDNVLWPGKICYALYKRYPNGFRFFLGHFRDKYDYDAEVEWLDEHEKDPEPVY